MHASIQHANTCQATTSGHSAIRKCVWCVVRMQLHCARSRSWPHHSLQLTNVWMELKDDCSINLQRFPIELEFDNRIDVEIWVWLMLALKIEHVIWIQQQCHLYRCEQSLVATGIVNSGNYYWQCHNCHNIRRTSKWCTIQLGFFCYQHQLPSCHATTSHSFHNLPCLPYNSMMCIDKDNVNACFNSTCQYMSSNYIMHVHPSPCPSDHFLPATQQTWQVHQPQVAHDTSCHASTKIMFIKTKLAMPLSHMQTHEMS
jgi:hypothetical protein